MNLFLNSEEKKSLNTHSDTEKENRIAMNIPNIWF